MGDEIDENMENTDRRQESRVRTHLANERTFLAWLRTALTAMTLGLAAAEFLTDDLGLGIGFPLTRALSITLVGGGLVILVVGLRGYIDNRKKIREGEFEPASTVAIAGSIIMGVAGVLALAFVLLVD